MSATPDIWIETFGQLEVCLLESLPDGGFVLHGEAPEWFRAIMGDQRESFDFTEGMPFLAGFLLDANEVWNGDQDRATSGPWIQELPAGSHADNGVEVALEARALLGSKGRRLLMIQRLTERLEEHRHVLQRARSALLEQEQVRKEIDRKELLLHCILHDLRGPLSGMVGTMSLVQSEKLSKQDSADLLALGLEQARHQESMIRSVLEAFAAEVRDLEAFEESPERAPDLLDHVDEVAKRYASAFRASDVKFEVHIDPSLVRPCKVVGRSDRLERVLENLLQNALRHGPGGTLVRLSVEPAAGGVAVTIDDEGPGVAPELRPSLFDKLSQDGRAKGVVGLGLWFCHTTLELWGGSIEYRDRPSGGASFRIHLRTPPQVTPRSPSAESA